MTKQQKYQIRTLKHSEHVEFKQYGGYVQVHRIHHMLFAFSASYGGDWVFEDRMGIAYVENLIMEIETWN